MTGRIRCLLVAVFVSLALTVVAGGQQTLQANTPIQRPLALKEAAHDYTLTTSGNQALTVTVDQQGIDVVVTVLGPDGQQLLTVDGASDDNGRGGSEVAHFAALAAGTYHVRVAPFDRPDAKPAAQYRITLSEVRSLTAEERANAESEIQIRAIEQRWEAAVDKFDVPTLSQILRADGFSMAPTGTVARDQVIARWENTGKAADKAGVTQSHTISEHQIRVTGATAVSTGRFLVTQRGKDQWEGRFSGQFIHVWSKDPTGWKLVGDYTFPFGRLPREKMDAPALSPAVLSSYAGTYRLNDGSGAVSLAVEDGALTAQFVNANPFDSSSSPKMPLRALSEVTFDGLAGNEITFVRGPNGDVRELLVVGDGPVTRAVRVK